MPFTRSNKITVFVAILILFLAGLLSGHLFLKNKYGYSALGDQIKYVLGQPVSSEAEQKQLDSDNDGLKDWEEKVYRTNPKKSDTDGDGYLDGEEVATGYDPTKKAPGDELAGAQAKSPRPLPKNLTKALAQKLGQSIFEGKIKSIDAATKEPLTSQDIENEPALDLAIQEAVGQQIEEFIIPFILEKDINISDKTGKEETLNYFNKMGEAVSQIPSDQPEMEIFAQAMDSGNFSKVKEIQKIYTQNYQRLKQVAVPADLVEFHKGILGVLWVSANIYGAVANIDDDPLKATIAIMQYEKIDDMTNQLIAEAIKQIDKDNQNL